MKYLIIAVALALIGGCGGDPPPAADAHVAAESHVDPLQNAVTPVEPTASGPPAVLAPPEGAQWTIYCRSFPGANHVDLAEQAKRELLSATRLTKWHIVHETDQSVLYYGYYDEIKNPQARADKQAMDAIADAEGTRLFPASLFVPLDSPDPTAPSQWDLKNTPPNMFWSLQIAAFRGTADRKERAVQAVRDARTQGIEAYYYHGEAISSVCIGAWPKEAVRQQPAGDTARTSNPDTPIIVANQPIPDGEIPALHDENGNPVPIFSPKVTIDDPSLQKMIDTYPEHAVNGYVDQTKDVNGKLYPSPSFLVEIPHREALLNDTDPNSPAAQQPTQIAPTPTDTQDDSLGKLRTIGDH